jgi:hypothetical protein
MVSTLWPEMSMSSARGAAAAAGAPSRTLRDFTAGGM